MSTPMMDQTRRGLLAALLSTFAAPAIRSAQAQQQTTPAKSAFGYEDVVERARLMAEGDYAPQHSVTLPEVEQLDFDRWRKIQFRNETDPLKDPSGRYKLQVFHLGHLFKKDVRINLIQDGREIAFDYSAKSFDYGSVTFAKPLPPDLGYAGFRVHYPLNNVRQYDELISFVGASYFRFLGRDQKYGLSARGLAIGTGNLDNNEEFPFFKEFWVERPENGSDRIAIYALMDSPSLAGAYRFDVYPQDKTAVIITASLFPRRTVHRLGMAPLTSMYMIGENDRHMNDRNKYDEFRTELHDSDGLLIHTSDDLWIWRPLKNPQIQEVQRFQVSNLKGFGLMQRDRQFSHYSDIELNYEERPSYWIEPSHDWGSGQVELVELATKDETADNIVCAFVPDGALEPGKRFTFTYKIRSMNAGLSLHDIGYVRDTYSAPPVALGSTENALPDSRRYLIDFSGGNLAYFLKNPDVVRIVASTQKSQLLRSFLILNPKIGGFRVMIDVRFEPDTVGTMQVFLEANGKAITESWHYAWRIYHL